jgi:hypothetical protein
MCQLRTIPVVDLLSKFEQYQVYASIRELVKQHN